VELAAEAIGRKTQEPLASPPADERGFRLAAMSPELWRLV